VVGVAAFWRSTRFQRWTLGLTLAIASTSSLRAAEIPGAERAVGFNAREQGVGDFVGALFRELSIPLVLHSEIEGAVNGRFEGTAREVLDEIADAYDLMIYYDGAVANVYPANEVSQTLLPLDRDEAERVQTIAEELDLPDANNKLTLLGNGSLLATGTQRFVQQVEEIIITVESTPAPVAPRPQPAKIVVTNPAPTDEDPKDNLGYRVFRLKHAWADDKRLAVGGGGGGGESVWVPGVASTLRALVSAAPLTYRENRGAGPDDGPRALQGLGSSGSVDDVQSEVLAPLRTAAGNDTDIRIVADTRMNAVIIRDREDRMAGYADLVASLDIPSEMVEIEATIIDILTDRAREVGVNWRYLGDDAGALLGAGDNTDLQLLSGASARTPIGRGGVLSFVLGEQDDFLARVRLLEERGAADVVSKPHVITLTDLEAVLSATTEFFVRVAGDQAVDLFSVPVGTTLRVTPHVFPENGRNKIKLLVRIEDGSQSNVAQVDQIPVIDRATLSTQAVIDEGDSLLIGGLVRDSSSSSDYRIPILGDIPLLGRLFRSTRRSVTRVERLFLITPRVSNGIGFGPAGALPQLQGRINDVTADAGQRLDDMVWPPGDRIPADFGPAGSGKSARRADSRRPVDSQRPDQADGGASRARVASKPDPISGFTVEPWPKSGGNANVRSAITTTAGPAAGGNAGSGSSSDVADVKNTR